jgi:hypothetical protein
MNRVFCPRCSTETVRAGDSPFCSICGWNCDRVEEAIRAKLRFSFMEILLPFLFLWLVRYLSKGWGKVFFFGLLNLAAFLYLHIKAKRNLELIKSVKPTFLRSQSGDLTATNFNASSLPRSDPVVEQLAALPRPRVVRFTSFGRTVHITLVIGWVVLTSIMTWSGYQDLQHDSSNLIDLVWTWFFPLFTGLLLSTALISEQRNRELLRKGDLVPGRVISQRRTGGKHPRSVIVYSFTDRSGVVRQRESTDTSRSYFEEMIVPVFYDPQDPNRSLALCETYLKIVTPEGRLLPEEQT